MFRFIKKTFDTRAERGILSFEQTEELAKSLGVVGRDLSFLIINTHKNTGLKGQDLVDVLKNAEIENKAKIEPINERVSSEEYYDPISTPRSVMRAVENERVNYFFDSYNFDYSKVDHIPREIVDQIRESNPTISADLIASMFKDCKFGKD